MTGTGFRLGFLSHVEGGDDLRQSYLNVQELFVAADELGFDSGWVAQHHTWPSPHGGLPSPWVFLAHAAARTRRIHLGTAITIAPLEDPIRLAEDVGVLDQLSGGRVELGIGSGYSAVEYALFGKEFERKRELTTAVLERTREALRGAPLDDEGTTLIPASADLADTRLWHGVFSEQGARYVAAEGTNLLLNRATYGYDEPTDAVQRPWADAYLEDWRHPRRPRIGLSRLILAAEDRATALTHLADGVLDGVRRAARRGGDTRGTSLEDALFHFNAYYGHPDEIIPRLRQERVLPVATDLLAQFNPGTPTLDASLRALEYLAREIAPALGWIPAHERSGDSQPDERPLLPGGRPGAAPGDRSGAVSGDRPEIAPGDRPETTPGGRRDTAPGDRSGAASGDRPGAIPGDRPGAATADRSGVASGRTAGQRPGTSTTAGDHAHRAGTEKVGA